MGYSGYQNAPVQTNFRPDDRVDADLKTTPSFARVSVTIPVSLMSKFLTYK